MSTFRLPDLGEGLQEAEIVAWHVAVGDHVVTDQPLVSVETDKAVVEVPAPQSGHVSRLFGAVGERVAVDAPLVEFADQNDAGTGHQSATVVGEISRDAEFDVNEAQNAAGHALGVKAPPVVRALARKLGVDLSLVQATGPGHTVSKADVERAAKALAGAGPPEPLRGVRRAMAEKMARAGAEVVPATVHDEADIDDWADGTDVTWRLIRAIVVACRAAPALNAWFDAAANTRRLHRTVELGLAVNTDDGLFVPVLRDVGNRQAAEIRAGIEKMKADLRARAVPPEELRGQSITLSNFGTLAGIHAQMVIVPPQVAILGAGKIAPRVVARDQKPVVRRILPLSITFDHRAVTGGEAGAFMAAAIADLETPV